MDRFRLADPDTSRFLRIARLASLLLATVAVAVAAVGVGAAGPPEGPVPDGPQFQVNTHTTSYQQSPAVAIAPGGGGAAGHFVVLWETESSAADPSSFGIAGQMLDGVDAPMGTEFVVNTYTMLGQGLVDVALAAHGEGVAVWASPGSDGTDTFGTSIQARLIGSDGHPVASDFQVNTETEWNQSRPSVAMRPSGDFVVVWQSDASTPDDEGSGIRGQLFDAFAMPLGIEFQVNSHTTLYQERPRVAMAPDGEFVVVWESNSSPGTDVDGRSVLGRRFDAFAMPLGIEFQANEQTTGNQYEPDVASSPSGEFFVTWTSSTSAGDPSGTGVRARRFDAFAMPLGSETQINEATAGHQRTPRAAMARSRDVLVTWASEGSAAGDTDGAIVGRWFDEFDRPLGIEFLVNSYTTGLQRQPTAAVAPNGDFLVTWMSEGSPGDDDHLDSIQARRFAGRILADGFEDGTLGLWQSMPSGVSSGSAGSRATSSADRAGD